MRHPGCLKQARLPSPHCAGDGLLAMMLAVTAQIG